MKYIKTYENYDDLDKNNQRNDDLVFKFKEGDYVKKIIPSNNSNCYRIIELGIQEWLLNDHGRKYYRLFDLDTDNDEVYDIENNLKYLEDYELAAIKYNL
jgi:hypothetical protein